jgi:hypothetical protein
VATEILSQEMEKRRMKWGAFSFEMYQIPIAAVSDSRPRLAYVFCLITEPLSIRIKGWFFA